MTTRTSTSVTPSHEAVMTGSVTALAAVTGVRDLVGDVIEPGAFAGVDPRRVRMHARHRWADEIGDVHGLVELLPGDPRLPARTPDGRPWPRTAGGLWLRGRFRLDTTAGRAAHREAKARGTRGRWSVGYVARDPRRVGDTRYLPGIDTARRPVVKRSGRRGHVQRDRHNPVVRALLAACGTSGLVVGLLCAVLTRYLTPEPVITMTTPRPSAYESALAVTYDWSTGFVILPAAGLLVGLLIGVALRLGGWRLRRA